MPEGGVLARFYRPGGGGFELLSCPGGGEFAHQKNCLGFCPGGWSGLELTDTLLRLKHVIQETRLYCNGPTWGEFKYCTEGLEEGFVPAISGGKEKNSLFQK